MMISLTLDMIQSTPTIDINNNKNSPTYMYAANS